MKFNFRKIASVLASTVMVSSTIALAAAANYPAPFVTSGQADAALVWGTTAASTDLAAVTDITNSLNGAVTSSAGTTSLGDDAATTGETFPLFTGGTKIYINDTLNKVKTVVTDSELPTILTDGDFSGNVDAEYTQTIVLGSNPRVTFAKQPDSSDDDPAVGLALGTTATSQTTYNATVTFDKTVNFTHADSEGEDITLFGQKFTVGTATDDDELVLFKSSQTVSLSIGGTDPSSQSVTVDGKTYTVDLVSSSDTSATVKVTDSSGTVESKEINEAASKKIAGLEVAINRADETNSQLTAEVTVGAQKVVLKHGDEVKVGSDADPVDGTFVSFSNLTDAQAVQRVASLTIITAAQDSDLDAVMPGKAYVDPVFGTFKLDFAGLNVGTDSTDRETFEIKASGNDKFSLKMLDHQDKEKSVIFINNESVADLADGSKNPIYVVEAAAVNKSQYMVVGNEDEGHLIEVKTLTNSSSGYDSDAVEFQDVFSDKVYKTTITADGTGTVTIGGKSYGVTYSFPSTTDSAARTVRLNYPDSSGVGSVVVYPTIETSKGAKVMLYEPVTIDLDSWDGAGNDVTQLRFPDGDGYTDITVTYSHASADIGPIWNFTSGTTVTSLTTNTSTQSADFAVGRLHFNATTTGTINDTQIRLENVAGTAITTPGLVIIEEQDDSANRNYEALITTFSYAGTSGTPMQISDIETTWGGDAIYDHLQLESNDDYYQSMDLWGTLITEDQSDTDQRVATISYPDEQVYALVYAGEKTSAIGGGGTTGNVMSVKDSEVSSVSAKNLIVVGGSCVNTVAATLLGSSSAVCGADFTSKTGVAADQFLISTYASPYASGKIATLVAGYNAGDTTNAATYLRTQTVDTSSGKKYIGTSATSAILQVA